MLMENCINIFIGMYNKNGNFANDLLIMGLADTFFFPISGQTLVKKRKKGYNTLIIGNYAYRACT